jgi:DNA-directed RNA polymerase subunit RPC12/RpoP
MIMMQTYICPACSRAWQILAGKPFAPENATMLLETPGEVLVAIICPHCQFRKLGMPQTVPVKYSSRRK